MESKRKAIVRGVDNRKLPKKPYQTPRMTVNGTIEKITKGSDRMGSDYPLGSRPI